MKLKKTVFVLAMSLLVPVLSLNAQQVLRGKIQAWEKGEAKVAFYDMITGEVTGLGQVVESGNLEIVLPEDFSEQVRAMAEKAQEQAGSGWTLRKNTVTSSFDCGSEDLVISQAEAEVMGLPELALANEYGDPVYGVLMAASSRQMADWLYSYGEKDAVTGYYVRWFYLEEPASVKGNCSIDFYTGHGEEMFREETIMDLELTRGWNIVKTEITRVHTDQGGKSFPATFINTRIDELPEDLGWFAMESEY